MDIKKRLVKTNIFICHQIYYDKQFKVNMEGLQKTLRNCVSYNGDGKACNCLLNIMPAQTDMNTVDVELVTFDEEIDLINETNISHAIEEIVANHLNVYINFFYIKQQCGPLHVLEEHIPKFYKS